MFFQKKYDKYYKLTDLALFGIENFFRFRTSNLVYEESHFPASLQNYFISDAAANFLFF